MKETKNGQDCKSVARLENLRCKHVNKRNTCKTCKQESNRNFEQKLSRNSKEYSKRFYNYVCSKLNERQSVGLLIKEEKNGEVIVDDLKLPKYSINISVRSLRSKN